MKGHITVKQLSELTDKQLEKLKMLFYPPYHQLQVIDERIVKSAESKVIEITNEHGTYVYFTKTGEFYPLPSIGQMMQVLGRDECDSLWEEVKKKL